MNTLIKSLSLLVVTAVFAGVTVDISAQERDRNRDRGERGGDRGGRGGDRGNFDRSQIMERIMERYRENLGISVAEWKVVQPKVQAVMDNRISGASGMMSFFGGRGSRGRGDSSTEKTPTSELRDLLEKENPAKGEIKAKLAAYRADRKAREAKLNKAQEDLRQLLTLKQEAQAVLSGLLN
ncbi:MAG: hypothetical protein QF749_02260 [Verrucomicrobiota bacterium]|jgi:hypothetical protein|nr:hypothetical protein [Verrucomicrobiota bacterium]|tara:strand:- start:33 stop:575 length:543 start_codon:yes stop_codon:yes gene_type:complete